MRPLPLLLALLLLISQTALRADRLRLKDGTVLEGTVIPQPPNAYWIKTPDGRTQTIEASSVRSYEKGGSSPGPSTTPAATAVPPTPAAAPSFLDAKARAEAADTPVAALTIWQKFLDANPAPPAADQARAEMVRWQQLADARAERIDGRWVGGDELASLVTRATGLCKEAATLIKDDKTLAAKKKLEEAVKLYPNSYPASFMLGALSLAAGNADDGIRHLEQAIRQRPDAPEALTNLGLAYAGKKQWERAITTIERAAEAEDSKQVAQDLINVIASAPDSVQKNPRLKPAIEASRLLGAKFGLTGPTERTYLLPLAPNADAGEPAAGASPGTPPAPAGLPNATWSGSGFVITPDGLILTNRHVADAASTLLVVFADGTKHAAELFAVDADQDLALVKLAASVKPQPFVTLAKADAPGDGADCTVLGYPLIDRLGSSIKVTRGIVSSSTQPTAAGADILIDAKVNPGNSGGPIVDRFGNVMAIVSMKSRSSATEDSYGLGISAGRVRKFLAKNHVNLPPAAPASADGLSTEDVVAKVKPACVCILATK